MADYIVASCKTIVGPTHTYSHWHRTIDARAKNAGNNQLQADSTVTMQKSPPLIFLTRASLASSLRRPLTSSGRHGGHLSSPESGECREAGVGISNWAGDPSAARLVSVHSDKTLAPCWCSAVGNSLWIMELGSSRDGKRELRFVPRPLTLVPRL